MKTQGNRIIDTEDIFKLGDEGYNYFFREFGKKALEEELRKLKLWKLLNE